MSNRPILLFAALALAACNSAELSDASPELDILRGSVVSIDGDALADVLVEVAGLSTRTDAAGMFSVAIPPTGAPVDVLARPEGYSVGHRKLDPGARTAIITVLPARTATVDLSSGAPFVGEDGVQIAFAPGGVIDANGEVVSGEITVSWALLNTVEDIAAAPGGMRALQGNNELLLESFGMVDVQLSQDGEPLNLGSPATIRWPMAETSTHQQGDRIPLWLFDEAQGFWTREGEGYVQNGQFVAEVPHFTWWNADVPMSTTCIRGRAVDITNRGIVGTAISEGIDYMGSTMQQFSYGNFEVLARVNSRVSLVVQGDGMAPDAHSDWEATLPEVITPAVAGGGCKDVGTLLVRDRSSDYDDDGFSPVDGDCDDADPERYPGAVEAACLGIDANCDGEVDLIGPDEDDDGYPACGDCDDARPQVYPDAPRLCDGVLDNDCDGVIDPAEQDDDGDGFSECAGDCDDTLAGTLAGCSLSKLTLGERGGCGVRPNETLHCWGPVAPFELPEGVVTSVAVNDDLVCWTSGSVQCAQGANVFTPSQSSLHALTGFGSRVAGLRPDGSVGFLSSTDSTSVTSGGLERVALGADHLCAESASGVLCDLGYEAPAGAERSVVSGDGFSCALNAGGEALCWGPAAPAGVPAGTWSELAAGESHVCARSDSGSLACWGDDSFGQLQTPAGDWTAVYAGGATTCATDSAGGLQCWGRDDLGQASPF